MGPVSIGVEVQWNTDGDTPSIQKVAPKRSYIYMHFDECEKFCTLRFSVLTRVGFI